jgi:NIMA (never in mitosis gene a)-related kinase 1/4/5
MVSGLKALHDKNILHRDLKCANIFMNRDGIVKMGDLNVSKVAKYGGLLFTQTGTPYYASPEVWKDQPYDNKSDIWSLGCLIYEMATLQPPFKAPNMDLLYKKVLSGQYPSIPNTYSNELAVLIGSLLQVIPQKRPSCDHILQHSKLQ